MPCLTSSSNLIRRRLPIPSLAFRWLGDFTSQVVASMYGKFPDADFGGPSACTSMNKDAQFLMKGRPDACYNHQHELRYSGMREGRNDCPTMDE